jgi:hypothetical protein
MELLLPAKGDYESVNIKFPKQQSGRGGSGRD